MCVCVVDVVGFGAIVVLMCLHKYLTKIVDIAISGLRMKPCIFCFTCTAVVLCNQKSNPPNFISML